MSGADNGPWRPVRLSSLVGVTARQWRRAVDQRLQPFSLTEASWLPLVHLARTRTPLRQKDLAAALSVESPALVRILAALEAAGLIEREDAAGDRRAKAIRVTPAGRRLAERVEHVSADLERELTAEFPERDVATARAILERILERLTGENEKARGP
jgi:MarR family transcriptional regulator for hemolysin